MHSLMRSRIPDFTECLRLCRCLKHWLQQSLLLERWRLRCRAHCDHETAHRRASLTDLPNMAQHEITRQSGSGNCALEYGTSVWATSKHQAKTLLWVPAGLLRGCEHSAGSGACAELLATVQGAVSTEQP